MASTPASITHRRMEVGSSAVMAEVFDVSLRDYRLIPVLPTAAKRATVDALRRESGAQLVVNGTFFDEHGRTLGLLQGMDGRSSPLRHADWGVFESTTGGARLVHTDDYVVRDDIEFAVQCGPRVVIDGRVPSLKPQVAQRTALCIGATPTEVHVVVTRGRVDASVLGRWMAEAPAKGGLGCRDALLLDGGPSTQLSARTSEVELDIPGGWPVPNGIGVIARDGPPRRTAPSSPGLPKDR